MKLIMELGEVTFGKAPSLESRLHHRALHAFKVLMPLSSPQNGLKPLQSDNFSRCKCLCSCSRGALASRRNLCVWQFCGAPEPSRSFRMLLVFNTAGLQRRNAFLERRTLLREERWLLDLPFRARAARTDRRPLRQSGRRPSISLLLPRRSQPFQSGGALCRVFYDSSVVDCRWISVF